MFWTGINREDDQGLGDRLDSVEMSQAAAFVAAISEVLNGMLGFRKSLEQNSATLGDGRSSSARNPVSTRSTGAA